MTSTNVFTGFNADKNSSRVLKPPGGGQTDIFGAPDPPIKRDSGRNTSSILEGTNVHSEKPVKPPTAVKAEPPKMAQQPEPAATSRSRVPPGGHSSGPLW